MRAIDKQGKDFSAYFQKRLVKDLRKLKHFVDEYYSGDNFNEAEKNFEKALEDHFSLVGVLRNCGFYPEDYVPLYEHLILLYEGVGRALYPKEYFDIPLDDYLNKYKHVAPFEKYLCEDARQLELEFS